MTSIAPHRAVALTERIAAVVHDWGPGLLYGARLAAGVVLALYLGFFLQLENPSWAGTSAAIVSQTVLGASLRKGVFRLVGTVVGATATVLLTAAFPQDRIGFLLGLALWCALCSFVATLLRNFAAYAAMLAGYTMAIVASSSMTEPTRVFEIALSRATEIGLGIVCSMLVMSLTSPSRSPRSLATAIAAAMAEIAAGLTQQLAAGGHMPDAQDKRRALVKRVAGLDPLLDQSVGESPSLGARRSTLQAGVSGLFAALASWRTVAAQLATLPTAEAQAHGADLLSRLPKLDQAQGDDLDVLVRSRDHFAEAEHALRTWAPDTVPLRLGADRMASMLDGFKRAANAEILLLDPRRALPLGAARQGFVPDLLPPIVNALRTFAAIGAAIMVWVLTSWPSGLGFITFVTVTVMLLSPRDEQAYSAILGFAAGSLLTAAVAGVVKFAVLPNHEGYLSLALIIAATLIPLAALSTRPSLGGTMLPATMNFIPLLAPSNVVSYDIAGFANSALAIVGGCVGGAVVLRIIPPVPPQVRTERLLALTLRDLRGAARQPDRWTAEHWRTRIYSRLSALPPGATPVDASCLLGALTVALQLEEFRRGGLTLGLPTAPILAVERSIAAGDLPGTDAALRSAREAAAGLQGGAEHDTARLRFQGSTHEIGQVLATYADYFGATIR